MATQRQVKTNSLNAKKSNGKNRPDSAPLREVTILKKMYVITEYLCILTPVKAAKQKAANKPNSGLFLVPKRG